MAIIETKSSLDSVVRDYGFPDVHIGGSEDESPWVPFKGNTAIRHLADRQALLKCLAGRDGPHEAADDQAPEDAGHDGKDPVLDDLEYDWVARVGSYVQESPGAIHTLVSDQGMKTMFWLNGSLEFFDEKDNLLETLDVFWMMDHYLSYCREHRIKVNQKLFV